MIRPEDRPFEVAQIPATIANAASLSPAVDIGGLALAAILMPASWTAADLTLQASYDNVNFFDVYDVDGEFTVPVAASQLVLLDVGKLTAMGNWIKVRSGTAGTPVAQGAERVVTLIARAL